MADQFARRIAAFWREASDLPAGWHSVLELPGGGWVSGAALVRALVAASGARLIRGRAARVWAGGAVLEGGETINADQVICCGGSFGAGPFGVEAGVHRAGSLLLLDRAPPQPLSFGAYLSPAQVGGVLGATFEAPAASHAQALALGLPLKSLDWLLAKGAALSNLRGVSVTGRWTGVRLSPLRCGPDESGVWHLSGLGSKGFLLGPLLARGIAGKIGSRGAYTRVKA